MAVLLTNPLRSPQAGQSCGSHTELDDGVDAGAKDTFTDLRQILLDFGHPYDAGGHVFVLQDTQQESAIIIVRVLRGAPFLGSIPSPSFWLIPPALGCTCCRR